MIMFFRNKIKQEEDAKIIRQESLEKHEDAFISLDDSTRTAEQEEGMVVIAEEMISDVEEVEFDKTKLNSLDIILKKIDIEYFEKLMVDLNSFLKGKIREEISGPKERYDGRLEALVHTSLMKHGSDIESADGKVHVVTAIETISEIYYKAIKNHPFMNGNKKLATAFLIDVASQVESGFDSGELANLALYIAQSDAKDYEVVIRKIGNFIKSRL